MHFTIDIEYVFSDGIDMVLSQVHIKKINAYKLDNTCREARKQRTKHGLTVAAGTIFSH